MSDVEVINEGFEGDTVGFDFDEKRTEAEFDYERDLYEKTINSCGFGYFQVLLLLISGWALASDSVEVQVVSFVLPSACDLDMTSRQKGWLNAIIFVGMMIGGYVFGGAADVKGRRYILLWSMSINGVFGLASAFAPVFEWFLFLRLLSGIGVGAAMPVIFSYCVEFMSRERRGPMIGFLASFWMTGNIMTCVLAWLIIPRVDIGGHINDLVFGSWRVFVAIGAFPSLSSALLLLFMPESPLYLQKAGRYEEAKEVFIQIFRRNFGKKTPIPREIKEFSEHYSTYMKIQRENIPYEKREEPASEFCAFGLCVLDLLKTVIKVVKSTMKLFSPPHAWTTMMLITIWFTLSFGYYGLWMWFPEIFKRVEDGGGSTCTGGVHEFHNITNNLTCLESVAQGKSLYLESFLVAISNIPGNVLTVLIVNRVGRRPLMAVSMILSGISVFFFYLVTNRTAMIVMSCIFSGMSVAGWNVLDMLSIENYPTNLRSTAFGVQSGFGRIAAISGNVVFGAMVDQHCAVPLILIAILLAVGGLIALKLPKTDNAPLT